jgi:hypothetical protein
VLAGCSSFDDDLDHAHPGVVRGSGDTALFHHEVAIFGGLDLPPGAELDWVGVSDWDHDQFFVRVETDAETLRCGSGVSGALYPPRAMVAASGPDREVFLRLAS